MQNIENRRVPVDVDVESAGDCAGEDDLADISAFAGDARSNWRAGIKMARIG